MPVAIRIDHDRLADIFDASDLVTHADGGHQAVLVLDHPSHGLVMVVDHCADGILLVAHESVVADLAPTAHS